MYGKGKRMFILVLLNEYQLRYGVIGIQPIYRESEGFDGKTGSRTRG